MAEVDRGQAARVRDLCRRLKPVVGQQAERIWLAYVAEDEDGKTQIEEYLEILAAQHFLGSLDSEGPGLIPPKSHEAAGQYALGTVAYNNRDLYPFGLRESEWTQHAGVFGRSGAGKTNLGFLIVQELVAAGKPVMVFDWKRNYRDLLALPGYENLAVYTIGRPISPLSFNPLVPPAQTNPKTWLKKLISVVAHAYLLGDGVIYLLQEAIDLVYEKAGVYSGQVERWPTFRDVFDVLKKRASAGREAGWLSSALRALSSMCFGEMDVLLNQGNDDLAQLLTRPVILELDALTQSDKVFCVQALLLWIHHYRMAEPDREQFKHAILVEEAHHVLSNERQSLVGGQSVMEITFREIREFGEAMVILDQHPSQISMPALGNTYCTICFNLKHRTDVNAMAQAMMLKDDEKDVLGNLQVGQAVVRLQGRSVKPFMISVPEFKIQKGAFTDTRLISHMTRLGLLSARGHSRLGRALLGGTATAPSPEQAFLLDVAEFPDSGVAERYKRLGLSVRQGQKLKAGAVTKKLIQEETVINHRGKLHVIRLTEEGRLASSGFSDTRRDAV
jgi:hypothetical protein